MITADWSEEGGWSAPELKPYGNVSMAPSASCLQYATECFEGLKLYRGYDGQLRFFRPKLNCRRFTRSATRIALPPVDEDELLKLMKVLAATDGPRWLPKSAPGTFLYVRPSMVATDPCIGVQRPQYAMFMLFFTLMAPLYDQPNGLKLLASEANTIRAWPGGFGYAKVGANYGPTLKASGEAREKGFQQVLWLFPGQDGALNVTESGASNFLVVWKTKEGKQQLVTAPIAGNLILEGVTRASVLALARERFKETEVVERIFNMHEIVEAVEEGRMVEAFTTGTAFFIAPVCLIEYNGKRLDLSIDEWKAGTSHAAQIRDWLWNIQYGKEKHEWSVVVDEEPQK